MINYDELHDLVKRATGVELDSLVSHTGSSKQCIEIIANILLSTPPSLKLTEKEFRNGFEYALIYALKRLCERYAENMEELMHVEKETSLSRRLIRILTPSKKEISKLKEI